jgi:hypothetical protein
MRGEDAERLGSDLGGAGEVQARAAALADAVRKWSRAGVGLATWFEDLPGSTPPVVLVGMAAAWNGRVETREYRLGGDAPSIRIRCATLALDLLRRSLAAS